MSTDTDNVVELHFQYAQNGYVMTDDTYGEQDADSAVAFTRDGCAFVAVRHEALSTSVEVKDLHRCYVAP